MPYVSSFTRSCVLQASLSVTGVVTDDDVTRRRESEKMLKDANSPRFARSWV